MRFADLTAPEIRALDRDRTLLVAPIAAVEQHSDHLPTGTDAILVGAVADGLEAARPDRVLLLPVQWLGASEHHLPFGGTLTATLPTYEQLLVETADPSAPRRLPPRPPAERPRRQHRPLAGRPPTPRRRRSPTPC